MSTMSSKPMLDVKTLRRGIEERDAGMIRSLYADDAQMTIVDQRDQPSHPHEIAGSAAIGAFLEETYSRAMEHRLEQVILSPDGSHAAYLERCRYPDGTKVMSTSMLDLRDGRIVTQTSLQAWDEAGGTGAMAEAGMSERLEHLDFGKPDEVRTFPHGHAEILRVGDGVVGRFTLEPGWRWSQDVKPMAGTEWCEAPHFQYHLSGVIRVHMADGTEFDAKAGEVTNIPPGHDAWVVGDENVVTVDWQGAMHYAEKT
jgi:hypothetical protein